MRFLGASQEGEFAHIYARYVETLMDFSYLENPVSKTRGLYAAACLCRGRPQRGAENFTCRFDHARDSSEVLPPNIYCRSFLSQARNVKNFDNALNEITRDIKISVASSRIVLDTDHKFIAQFIPFPVYRSSARCSIIRINASINYCLFQACNMNVK